MNIYILFIFFPLLLCSHNNLEIDPKIISKLPCGEIIQILLGIKEEINSILDT